MVTHPRIVINDWTMKVTVPTGMGLMVITNVYGSTCSPVTVGGFADLFNRSNRALDGDGNWQITGGANTFNIVSDYLDCGYPTEAYCTIFNNEPEPDEWLDVLLI